MNLDKLIGKKLEDACRILETENLIYSIEQTVGHKDKEILKEAYVLRIISKNNAIILTTGLFKTTI